MESGQESVVATADGRAEKAGAVGGAAKLTDWEQAEP
jgi:hypothetical protein